jgi:hypothetical protein
MNIPQTGINPQKSKFFQEIAHAFEFLALYHSLPETKQLELMQTITKYQGGENVKA